MPAKIMLILLVALFGATSEPSLGQTPRRVLVFGDSNTFGSVPLCEPGGKRRFEADERWGGVLRRELGSNVQIIEDGMINRAAGMGGMKGSGAADPTPSMLNGARAIAAAIDHHGPLDLVVMMLGTNDLQSGYRRDIEEIAQSIVLLAVDVIERRTARGDKAVGQVLIVTPPPIAADIQFAMFRVLWPDGAERSRELDARITSHARARGLAVAHAPDAVNNSDIGCDGVHLTLAGHAALGRGLASAVWTTLSKR